MSTLRSLKRLFAIALLSVTPVGLTACSEEAGNPVDRAEQRVDEGISRAEQEAKERAEAEAKRRAEERARSEVTKRMGNG